MKDVKGSELIHDALEFLDDDMIEEVDQLRSGKTKKADNHKMNIVHLRKKSWIAIAASVCVLVIISGAWNSIEKNEGMGNTSQEEQLITPENSTVTSDDTDENHMQDVTDNSNQETDALPEQEGVKENSKEEEKEHEDVSLENFKEAYFYAGEKRMSIKGEDSVLIHKFLEIFLDGEEIPTKDTLFKKDAITENDVLYDFYVSFANEPKQTWHFYLLSNGYASAEGSECSCIEINRNVYKALTNFFEKAMNE